MSILLPLYMYPWPGVWDPLYWAAANNPTLNFTVILNPCSGPCVETVPESPYLTEIPRLKDYANIRTLGYVATNYTNKPIENVLLEIQRYANWTHLMNDERVRVDGVFFDETPGAYDWQSYDYLKRAQQEVHFWEGLGEKIIVHNPGIPPFPEWNYLNLTDITVVFEETFSKFINADTFNTLKALPAAVKRPKSAFAIMLHSLPNIPDSLLDWTVNSMKELVEWNFISSVSAPGEYWHSFSSVYGGFVEKYARR